MSLSYDIIDVFMSNLYLFSGRQNDWGNVLIGWPLELADDLGQLTVRAGGINDPKWQI